MYIYHRSYEGVRVMVFNSTYFRYIVAVIIGGGHRSTHRITSHWQTLPHNGVSSTPRL